MVSEGKPLLLSFSRHISLKLLLTGVDSTCLWRAGNFNLFQSQTHRRTFFLLLFLIEHSVSSAGGLKIGPVSRPSINGHIVFLSCVDSFQMMFVCWSYLRVGVLPRVFVLAAPVLVYSRRQADRVVVSSLHFCKVSEWSMRRTELRFSLLDLRISSI